MAKKSRRIQSRKAAQKAAAEPQEVTQTDAASKTVDFSQEYRYVITDLKNMALLAVVMLGVLVGLSFIVQ